MTFKEICSILSGIAFLAGFFPIAISAVKGEMKLAKASWIIWPVVDIITLAGLIVAMAATPLAYGVVIGGVMMMLIALKYGESGWTKTDKYCLFGSAICLVLWAVTSDAKVAIISSLTIVSIAAVPTFVSTFNSTPTRGEKLSWTLYFVFCVLAVIAVPKWDLANAAQPVVFLAIQVVMVCLVWFPVKNWATALRLRIA